MWKGTGTYTEQKQTQIPSFILLPLRTFHCYSFILAFWMTLTYFPGSSTETEIWTWRGCRGVEWTLTVFLCDTKGPVVFFSVSPVVGAVWKNRRCEQMRLEILRTLLSLSTRQCSCSSAEWPFWITVLSSTLWWWWLSSLSCTGPLLHLS